MRRILIPLLLFFLSVQLMAQEGFDSRYGSSLSPYGRIRILTICVNIIYDQTPERDPFYQTETPQWRPGNPEILNDQPPVWAKDFLDAESRPAGPHGTMTRYFYESSLGNLLILGDFVTVNILQSEITPDNSGAAFNFDAVVRAALERINRLGGVMTMNAYHDIGDFDFTARGTPGKMKQSAPNGKIDFVMVLTRNTVRKEEKGKVLWNYGQNNPGEGYSYESTACRKCSLLMNGLYYENEITTVQSVGVAEYSKSYRNIAFHEFAHNLFGSNAFHSAGGNHFGTSNAAVFPGLQGGYGLMGGYNSSLTSCNAYDRWRLGWTDTVFNPSSHEVWAGAVNASVEQGQGSLSILLRDFVTTGDAIRIRLPGIDSNAAPQFLWLENHQVGRNGKIDFLQFSNEDACRDQGSPGIYAYIQVGRGQRVSDHPQEVFSGDETDNLRFLSAKGNWDYRMTGEEDTLTCIAWNQVKKVEERDRPNPLTGYNELQTHIYDLSGAAGTLNEHSYCSYPYRVKDGADQGSELPFLGDKATAFVSGSGMNIGSNPAPVNVVTHYTTQHNQRFAAYKGRVNTRKVYLSGLDLRFTEVENACFRVDIRWDNYSIRTDIRWAGPIVLRERLELEKGAVIRLEQCMTPLQLSRDTSSACFAPLTTLECEAGSTLMIRKGARMILDDRSKLIIRQGAELRLEKGSRLLIGKDCELIMETGSSYINEGGRLIRR